MASVPTVPQLFTPFGGSFVPSFDDPRRGFLTTVLAPFGGSGAPSMSLGHYPSVPSGLNPLQDLRSFVAPFGAGIQSPRYLWSLRLPSIPLYLGAPFGGSKPPSVPLVLRGFFRLFIPSFPRILRSLVSSVPQFLRGSSTFGPSGSRSPSSFRTIVLQAFRALGSLGTFGPFGTLVPSVTYPLRGSLSYFSSFVTFVLQVLSPFGGLAPVPLVPPYLSSFGTFGTSGYYLPRYLWYLGSLGTFGTSAQLLFKNLIYILKRIY